MECCPKPIVPVYAWHTAVQTVDVGYDRLLTPSAQLRLQQEAGEKHFGEGGLGFDRLAAMGMAFLILQNNARIVRRPMAGENIVVKTWSHSVKGIKFQRCYRFETEEGELLIDSMAVFVLVDVQSHRLLRPSDFPFEVPHAPDEPHTCPPPPRLREPKESEHVGTHRVTVSQLDFNSHLNNTRYADIAFDVLPLDAVNYTAGFSILFAHEARLGDVLRISLVQNEQEWLVCAHNGEELCFLARIEKI